MSKKICTNDIDVAAAEAVRVIARAADDAAKLVASAAATAMKDKNSNKFYDIPISKQISLWTGIGGFVGMIIMGYLFLSNPSRDNDTALQLQDQRITAQQKTIDGLNLTQQNDTKELKNEVAGLRTEMQVLTNSIVELKTIVAERIPPKK